MKRETTAKLKATAALVPVPSSPPYLAPFPPPLHGSAGFRPNDGCLGVGGVAAQGEAMSLEKLFPRHRRCDGGKGSA
jgi:hypothetical protein